MTRLTRREFLRYGSAALATTLLVGSGCAPKLAPTEDVVPTLQEAGNGSPTATHPSIPNNTPTTTKQNPTQTIASKQDTPQPTPTHPSLAYLAVAHGPDPEAITRAALAAIGGMGLFVKSGQDVIIKPNICVDYHTYEYAATTNPVVVATLVKMCLEAGARRVRVMDSPFGGTARSAYAKSGIEDAVKAVGGVMEIMSPIKYGSVKFPMGKDLKNFRVYKDVLAADVLINVPIAKTHSLAGLTLGGKNMLGLVEQPTLIHMNMGQRVADLVSLFRPTLTVIDAVRVLMANGPTGGLLSDVKLANTVIASADIVAADSYATTLFGKTGADISYIKAAAAMGLGKIDLKSFKIEEVNA